MNKISIAHISNSHNDQVRALDFYKQEIALLKDRLTVIGARNKSFAERTHRIIDMDDSRIM